MSSSIEPTFESSQSRSDASNGSREDLDRTVIRKGELIDISEMSMDSTADVGVGVGAEWVGTKSSTESLIGQQLDHFLIESLVGTGGMGAVFRGRDLGLDRIVAIKVVAVADRSAESMRRFRFEAQSAAKLDHPNIARVYYVGETDHWSYIVFEFVEGTNLREFVFQNGLLSIDDAVCLTRQVAEALQHASERKVVHRDIKPSNILVTQSGQAKLVDMGLARTTELDKSTNDLTASGVTLGTFDYISPEQAHDPRSADVRSDIYSLGCTLYFLLTGQPPFPDGTALQKLLLHGTKMPADPRVYRSDISDSMIAILRKMMAKKPSDRYQEPSDLINDLRTLAELEGLAWAQSSDNAVNLPIASQRTWLEASLPFLISLVAIFGISLWLHNVSYQSAAFPIPREEIPEITVDPLITESNSRELASQSNPNALVVSEKSTQSVENGSPKNNGQSKVETKSMTSMVSGEDTIIVDPNASSEKDKYVVRSIEHAIELAANQPQVNRIVLQTTSVHVSLSTFKSPILFPSNLTIQADRGQRCKWIVDGAESSDRIESHAWFECVADQFVLQDIDLVWRVNAMSRRRSLFSIHAGAWLQFKNCSITVQDELTAFNTNTYEPTAMLMSTPLPSVFLIDESSPDSQKEMLASKSPRTVARISGNNFSVRGQCDWLRMKSPVRTEVQLENGWMAIAGSMIDSTGNRTASRAGVPLRIDMRNITAYFLRSWMRCNLTNAQPYPIPTVRIANECVFTGCKSYIEWNAVDCQDWNVWEQSEDGQKLTKWIDLRGVDNTYDASSIANYLSVKLGTGSAHQIPVDSDTNLVEDERGLETAAAWKKRPLLDASRLHEANFEFFEWLPRSFQPGYQTP